VLDLYDRGASLGLWQPRFNTMSSSVAQDEEQVLDPEPNEVIEDYEAILFDEDGDGDGDEFAERDDLPACEQSQSNVVNDLAGAKQ
jgi:hypothetical protein